MLGLDLGVEMLRDDDVPHDAAALHVGLGDAVVVVVDDPAELRGVELGGEVAGSAAVVHVHDADGHVVGQAVPQEGRVEKGVEREHDDRRQQEDRPDADDLQLAKDDQSERLEKPSHTSWGITS